MPRPAWPRRRWRPERIDPRVGEAGAAVADLLALKRERMELMRRLSPTLPDEECAEISQRIGEIERELAGRGLTSA